MTTYTLVLADNDGGQAKRLEFEAQNSAEALRVVQGQIPRRTAELWRNDRRLGKLRGFTVAGDDVWQITA